MLDVVIYRFQNTIEEAFHRTRGFTVLLTVASSEAQLVRDSASIRDVLVSVCCTPLATMGRSRFEK